MTDNSDDYDFTPSSNSSLASLFGHSSPGSDNSSLIYTAPKQPKSKNIIEPQTEAQKVESSVICARVVQVWKLTDSKYVGVGKYGLAVIGSSISGSYEIILYKDKHNVIMRVKISPILEVSLKNDDFLSFYDNAKDNWLIKFSSGDDCTSIKSLIEKYGGKVTSIEKVTTNEKSVENDSTPENLAKADILSRIAKMGQSILPNKNLDEEEILETLDTKISSLSIENKMKESSSSALSPTSVMQPPRPIQNIPTNLVMSQPMIYDPLNFYISENRTHNSEVRMNLSQISDKLNHIMKLVDNEKSPTEPNSAVLKSRIKVLELRNENLVKELTIVQEENNKLKLAIQHKDNVLASNESKQLELRLAQEELERRKEIDIYKNNITDLYKVIEEQKSEIEVLGSKLVTSQSDEVLKLHSTISELTTKLKEFEDAKLSSQAVDEKNSNFISLLKEEMNGLYENVMSNIYKIHISEVSNIIAQNIKSTTMKIIQIFQQTDDPHSDVASVS